MKTRIVAIAALLLVAAAAGTARAADALASALDKVAKEQIAAFNREDAAATLSYAYSKSPAYDAAAAALGPLFSDSDVKAEQVSFRLIGHDDEFAIARVRVKVTGTAESGFQNNIVDGLMIFHTEGGAWKVWDTYLLGSELVK